MSFSKSLLTCGAALMMGAAAVLAADSGTTGAKPDAPAARTSRARLTKPWNELKDLTDDEKSKILEIHQKALDEEKAITKKEHEDILAVLTDTQKKEVVEIEAKEKSARSKKPTTQPAGASASSEK